MQVRWTEEQDARLRELFIQGVSFTQIGAAMSAEFKRPLTRNATIGRAHRLGLDGRKVIATPEQRAERAKKSLERQRTTKKLRRAQNSIMVRRQNGNAFVSIETHQQAPAALRIVAARPLHLDLIDLRDNQCRYPYGDGPFTFCGCDVFKSGSYCREHLELVNNHDRMTRSEFAEFARGERRKLIAEVIR